MKDQFVGDGIELDNALAFWIYRVYQGTRRHLYRGFMQQGYDITPEQWLILVRLWDQDGRLQTELCESTVKDGPTISRAVDVLESRSIVERRNSVEDARLRLVFLTRQGKSLRRKLVPVVRGLVERLESGVTELELIITRQTLRRMAANMDLPDGSEAQRPARKSSQRSAKKSPKRRSAPGQGVG
jgi:MarR family transcriptional regulator, organic hydroperoxide resistance regulator